MTNKNKALFLFKEPISIHQSAGHRGPVFGSIFGKVKDKDAYVVSLRSAQGQLYFIERFGFPNRNLQLEWGAYTGSEYEYIINGEDLVKRK